jgi:two-component system, LytTR family, sensor kinase
LVSIAATATIYQLYRPTTNDLRLKVVAGMEFSQILTYAPFTPFAYMLALRFPFRRGNWARQSLLHLGFGIVFTFGHILLKAFTPYGYFDPASREWTFAIWNSTAHAFRPLGTVLQRMFLASVVDDVSGVYVPILVVAHAIAYYQKLRTEELRAAQLEAQLAESRLQALKSQLQPHFLFNTMHSISALMLIDVSAADRMMCRLSDLLRISLESVGVQFTTLKSELEFVNCYLEIEKVRFEERLRVLFEVAPETLDAEVPHLLLQPLVDNAVKHGISKLATGGEIVIKSWRSEDLLKIEVRNCAPPQTGASSLTAGVGLRVTRERLDSIYGADHTFEFTRSPQNDSVARVCIPFIVRPRAEAPSVDSTLLKTG